MRRFCRILDVGFSGESFVDKPAAVALLFGLAGPASMSSLSSRRRRCGAELLTPCAATSLATVRSHLAYPNNQLISLSCCVCKSGVLDVASFSLVLAQTRGSVEMRVSDGQHQRLCEVHSASAIEV